ncbi:MAG: polyphenol oxidase family protein, partial [Gemmatimonadetes bacterium]|nr:polyphenol oxidase family protein [Gemmatimonadota bacterium]
MIRLTESGVHAREIEEVFHPGDPGVWFNPEWESRFPWLAQGITGRKGPDGKAPRNFARFADPPAKRVRHAWEALGNSLDFPRIAHSRQVHGRQVSLYEWVPSDSLPSEHDPTSEEGPKVEEGRMILGPDADGHLTSSPGVLLAVTVADCVPVFLVDPGKRVAGLLHAGWRGTVVGVLE